VVTGNPNKRLDNRQLPSHRYFRDLSPHSGQSPFVRLWSSPLPAHRNPTHRPDPAYPANRQSIELEVSKIFGKHSVNNPNRVCAVDTRKARWGSLPTTPWCPQPNPVRGWSAIYLGITSCLPVSRLAMAILGRSAISSFNQLNPRFRTPLVLHPYDLPCGRPCNGLVA
jgi:hypothetical protein